MRECCKWFLHWVRRFKGGRESVEDDCQLGRPSTSTNDTHIQKICDLVCVKSWIDSQKVCVENIAKRDHQFVQPCQFASFVLEIKLLFFLNISPFSFLFLFLFFKLKSELKNLSQALKNIPEKAYQACFENRKHLWATSSNNTIVIRVKIIQKKLLYK